MEIHTTNYYNTFIEVAEDCPVIAGTIPPIKNDSKSIANIQFELISQNPYKYTSDDILFHVYAERNNLTKEMYQQARDDLFSKGQACLRSSSLTKRYGWGIHCNKEAQVALYGIETNEYHCFLSDKDIKRVKALRSKKE